MLASTIASGALALGSAIYGAAASSKYNRQAQRLIQQQRQDNKDWYNARMSEDYTQRADAQNVINRQRELLDRQYKAAQASNVVSGGSDASLAMQKAAANDAMAQTMSDIASEAANYKDNVEKQYRAQDAALNQQQAQIAADQAKSTAQAASQTVNAGLNLMGVGMMNEGTGPKNVTNIGQQALKQAASAQSGASLAQQQKRLDETVYNDVIGKVNSLIR